MRCLLLLVLAALLPWPGSAQNTQLFVPIQPCRVVDTRGDVTLPATLVGPPITADNSRDFPLRDSPCGIPSSAAAYSLNVTVVPAGYLQYISIWPTGNPKPFVSTLNAPLGNFLANAAIVPAGVNGAISIYAHETTHVIVDINGYFVPYVAPVIPPSTTIQQITQQVTQQISKDTSLSDILAQVTNSTFSLGLGTGASIAGFNNTAVGYNALSSINDGGSNTALGFSAAHANVHGSGNVAIGDSALVNNASGSNNVAIGSHALLNSTDTGNVGIGSNSLFTNVNGRWNTSIGLSSMYLNNIGTNNIALGYQAGYNLQHDNNIAIGNSGAQDDSGFIRIGTPGTHSAAYIAGIYHTTLSGGGAGVLVDSNGQLGMLSSSRKTKEDIHDLPDESGKLLQLRPVQFRYKKPAPDGTKPIHYGLIAEDVDQVYPELVVRDQNNEIVTVAYQELPALLLKQIQEQQKQIAALEARIKALEAQGSVGTK